MTSVASLIEVDLASASSKYNNPTKNVLSGPYLAETRGAKMPSTTAAEIAAANWIDNTDTTYPSIQNRSGNPRGTISDNDYLNGSRFNNYPSQWREGLVRIRARSLDNQEQQVLGLVLEQLGDTTGATLITNRLAATGATGVTGPVALPANPTIGAITPGDTTARINFLPPSIALGGAATSYRYVVNLGATEVTSGTVTSSPILLSALTNGERYTITIYSLNSGGESAGVTSPPFMPTAAAAPPATPANPTASTTTDITATRATVNFTHGSATDTFTYTVNGASSQILAAGARSIPLTGLDANRNYSVVLKAVNGGVSSSGTTITFSTLIRPPNPTMLGHPASSTGASISFTHGSATDTFTYTVTNTSTGTVIGTADQPLPAGSDFIGLTGLSANTDYTVVLKAVEGGVSSSGTTLTFSTLPAAVSISTISRTDTTASVPYTGGGVSGVNYTYILYIGATGTSIARLGSVLQNSITTSTSPISLTGLTPNTTYSIVIKSANSRGSNDSTRPSFTTTAAAVAAPTAVTISTITPGNAQAIVQYTGGGAAGVTYKYTVYVGATTTTVSGKVDVTITGSPFTITGLNNGTAYTVIIKATNTGGSTDSARSSSFTPATTPGAPTITSITAIDGTGTATVAFTAPTSTGGAAITNYNYSINGATPVTLSPADAASPLTISSLVTGTTYSVIIRAINSVGAGAPSAASSITPQLYRFHATGFTLKTSALLRNGLATGAGTAFTFNETLAPANTYQVYYDTSITTSSAMSALKTNGMTATQLNYLFIKTPTSIYYLSAKAAAPNLDAIILFKRGSTTGNWNSGALDTTIYYTTNLTMGTRTVNTGAAMTTNRADFKPTFTPRVTVLGSSDVAKARAPVASASQNYIEDYGGGGKKAPHIKTRSNRKKFTNTRKNK